MRNVAVASIVPIQSSIIARTTGIVCKNIIGNTRDTYTVRKILTHGSAPTVILHIIIGILHCVGTSSVDANHHSRSSVRDDTMSGDAIVKHSFPSFRICQQYCEVSLSVEFQEALKTLNI